MSIEYRGYTLKEGKYSWVQIWHNGSYRKGCSTVVDAQNLIDVWHQTRLRKLIDTETMAMADAALASIFSDDDCSEYHPLSEQAYNFGQDFYFLQRESSGKHELDVVSSINKLIGKTLTFAFGYEDYEENAASEEMFLLETDAEKFEALYWEVRQQLRSNELRMLRDSTAKIIPHIAKINHYDQLVQLDPVQRQHLLKIERMSVEDSDNADDYIDGRTSGHHRDVLKILEHVAHERERDGDLGTVFMGSDGQLAFDVEQYFG